MEVPPPPSPISLESRASACFSEGSQHTECDPPRYIRPLPFIPPITDPNQHEPEILKQTVSSRTPTPAHTRTQSLHVRRNVGSGLLQRHRPQGPRLAQAQAQAHIQPQNSASDWRQSYPPFEASQSRKEVSSFLKPSYRTFSASSPSLQLRRAKLGSRVENGGMNSSRDTEVSLLSAERYMYNGFSSSSPSLVISLESLDEDQVAIAPNTSTSESDVPLCETLTGLGLYPPAPLRLAPHIHLPDLTGKIVREGDYPAGRGGYADVWKCDMRLTMDTDQSKVRQCDLT